MTTQESTPVPTLKKWSIPHLHGFQPSAHPGWQFTKETAFRDGAGTSSRARS